MNLRPGISVVIPVYNGAFSLPELTSRLCAVLPTLVDEFEIIFVEDNSRDNSWQVIETISRESRFVRGIRLMRNFGQHNALLCGIRAAERELIITMDDDLQNPPEEIPTLYALYVRQGADVVYGTPQAMKHNFSRNITSRITKLALQSSMGVDAATKVSAFRLFRTQVRDAFAEYRGNDVSIDVLLTWGTNDFTAVDIPYDERRYGTSNYTLAKLIRHAMNMITGFSVLPLQIASFVGFCFVLFGVMVFIFVVGRYLIEGGSVPGFPFLASTISIFSGVQLFALGIIGEYIARIHARSMNRPSYTVRQTTWHEKQGGRHEE
jgi:glycosyltransferase involved in cell wall biosynthesis